MLNIKRRLKDAYENVEFYANTVWHCKSQMYCRANQVLYAREMKVRDAFNDEPTRPRTVRDTIPQSKLAQYSNYEYDEARESSYTQNSNEILFYYPCIFSRGTETESWMLPEIEQLFIWLVYSADFELLEPMGIDPDTEISNQNHPIHYTILERTPGTNLPITEEDLIKFSPDLLKCVTFEDILQRIQLRSDNMKQIWNSLYDFNSFRAIQTNICVQYNFKQFCNYFCILQAQTGDVKILQCLSNSLENLQEIFNSLTVDKSFCNDFPLIDIPKTPTRRLYSAVLQGHASKELAQERPVTPTSKEPCYTSVQKSNSSFPLDVAVPSLYMETAQRSFAQHAEPISTIPAYKQTQGNTQYPYTVNPIYLDQFNEIPHPLNYCRQSYHQNPWMNCKSPPPTFYSMTHYSTNQGCYFVPPATRPGNKWAPPANANYYTRQQYVSFPQGQRWPVSPTSTYRSTSSQQITRFPRSFTDYTSTPLRVTNTDKTYKKILTPLSKNGNVGLCMGEASKVDGEDNEPLAISVSVSEELELEALEQYASSNENVYCELEKQAEEQYEEPENFLSPPNDAGRLGGHVFSGALYYVTILLRVLIAQ